MKAPGTAYDDPRLGGKDPQPAHMGDYVDTTDDNGGVHINSGIPNHAFYLAATALGGHSWEKAGRDLVRGAARSPHHRARRSSPTSRRPRCRSRSGSTGPAARRPARWRDAWSAVGLAT